MSKDSSRPKLWTFAWTVFLVLSFYCLDEADAAKSEAEAKAKSAPVAVATTASSHITGSLAPITRSNCRKFVMVLAKRLMKVLSGCIKELKADHPEKDGYNKYFDCAIKCGMFKTKMIDERGDFSNATFGVFVSEQIPEFYYPIVYTVGKRCIDKYEAIITGKGDPECKEYGNFVKCAQEDVSEHC